MKQYLDLLQRIIDEGEWVVNKRTQTRCKTIINADLTYHVDKGEFPLITTRKAFYRQAIGEMLGYLRGYTSTEQFHKLGVKTWDANAANPVWQNNPVCKGETDLGKIYGAAGNTVPYLEYSRTRPESGALTVYPGKEINVLQNIIKSLKEGNDDRGLIWNFWNPGLFHLGCLRPCMYEHQFSLINDTLYLNSVQRSQDAPLGGAFNMVQCYFLLWLMAKLTGKKPGKAYHKIVNAHIYENQLPFVEEQLKRQPYESPTLICTREFTLEDVFDDTRESALHPNDFTVVNYKHHPAIKYPFTV